LRGARGSSDRDVRLLRLVTKVEESLNTLNIETLNIELGLRGFIHLVFEKQLSLCYTWKRLKFDKSHVMTLQQVCNSVKLNIIMLCTGK
jgi:hypothetical protein